MTRPLDGIRVAITENRYPEQLTQLLERQGAIVHACPLLRETALADAEGADRFIAACGGNVDYVIFFTGVGVDFLFRAASDAGLIGRARVVARGPKAVTALRRAGVHVDLVAAAPTTEGIIETMTREDLPGKSVLVQMYGDRDNPQLAAALEARGAKVTCISLYRYTEASDPAAVNALVDRIVTGNIDAITFTSATQVPFFFEAAGTNVGAVRERLRSDVVVASVGEVTSRALREAGVEPHVTPVEPKMGPMVKALAEFFQQRSSACSTRSS